MRVTCEFGISGATRVPLRAARKLCVQNTCTCTARALRTLAPFFVRRQVGLAKVHPCTEFGVASSKFTFTGGPHVKTASSPLARAAGTPQKRHPQWILSWYSTRETCEFGISGAPRVTCRAVRNFVASFQGAARATCRRPTRDRHHCRSGVSARPSVPPRSRSDQPCGRCARKCLDTHTHTHTHTHTDKHQPANFFSATHRRKSSFIRTCYAKALAPFILYDFGLEAGIAKHCLGPKS